MGVESVDPTTETSPTPDKDDDKFVYEVSHDGYSDVRDITAAALTHDRQGSLDASLPSVLLQTSSPHALNFLDELLKFLASDMRVSLITFDLEDLEDLGVDFIAQKAKSHSDITTSLAEYFFASPSQPNASTEV